MISCFSEKIAEGVFREVLKLSLLFSELLCILSCHPAFFIFFSPGRVTAFETSISKNISAVTKNESPFLF